MDVCHRISARTRLATAEEKLLQATMSELENAVSFSINIMNIGGSFICPESLFEY